MEDTQSSSVSTSPPVTAKDESGTQKMGFFDAAVNPPTDVYLIMYILHAAITYRTREQSGSSKRSRIRTALYAGIAAKHLRLNVRLWSCFTD